MEETKFEDKALLKAVLYSNVALTTCEVHAPDHPGMKRKIIIARSLLQGLRLHDYLLVNYDMESYDKGLRLGVLCSIDSVPDYPDDVTKMGRAVYGLPITALSSTSFSGLDNIKSDYRTALAHKKTNNEDLYYTTAGQVRQQLGLKTNPDNEVNL